MNNAMKANVRCYTLDEALERASRPAPPDAQASRRTEQYQHWAWASYEDAMRMAQIGDPTEAIQLRKKLVTFPQTRPAMRTTHRLSETGVDLDIGRYLSGDPECLVDVVRATRPTMVLKIAVERAVHAGITPEEMRSTGASVLAAVEALRLAGFPSEIWVTFSQAGNERLSVQVLIQEAGRPVNLDVLGFWVANPAAFRRVGFAIEEAEDADLRRRCGIQDRQSYGFPVKTPEGSFDEVAPASSGQATRWLRDVLTRRAGIELEGGEEV